MYIYIYWLIKVRKSYNLFPTGHQLLFQDAKARLDANELPASHHDLVLKHLVIGGPPMI